MASTSYLTKVRGKTDSGDGGDIITKVVTANTNASGVASGVSFPTDFKASWGISSDGNVFTIDNTAHKVTIIGAGSYVHPITIELKGYVADQ